MSVDIYWRLPSHGDPSTTRNASLVRGDWTPTTEGSVAPGLRHGEVDAFSYVDHLADIARAAESAGFVGGLIPSFPMTDDPWIISSALAEETKTFRFMIAFQPGFANPVHVAHMSSSLQRLSHGRLVFNIITGGGGPEQAWWGDLVAHDDRYTRTKEFLDVLHGVWHGDGFEHRGRFYDITDGGLARPLRGEPFPEIYFSGSSAAGIDAAGHHADYYLSWLEPFDALRAKFDQVRRTAGALGREPKFAVRVDVLARDTHDEAWAEARRGFDAADPTADRPWAGRATDSVGAQRQRGFQPDRPASADDLLHRAEHLGGLPPAAPRSGDRHRRRLRRRRRTARVTSSTSGSTRSSSPACRTSRRPTASAPRSSRSSAAEPTIAPCASRSEPTVSTTRLTVSTFVPPPLIPGAPT